MIIYIISEPSCKLKSTRRAGNEGHGKKAEVEKIGGWFE
jgi:hypothetical protein